MHYKISVIIPVHNTDKYLYKCLQSIKQQTLQGVEIICLDDASTDQSLIILENFTSEYKDFLLLKNNKNYGASYSRNLAMHYAKGDYIFLADQDDVWYPNKVEKLLLCLTDYNCVVSDATVVNSDMTVIHESFMEINHSRKGVVNNLITNGFLGCCMAFSSSLLKIVLPFPKNIPMHDSWIGLNATLKGKVLFLDEPLIYYRRHESNASCSSEKSKNTLSTKIKHRYNLCVETMKRFI